MLPVMMLPGPRFCPRRCLTVKMCLPQIISSKRRHTAPSTCLGQMMVNSMSMGMLRLMPLMLTPLISPHTSLLPQMRPATQWAVMMMSKMLPAMMLRGPRFCHLRFLTVRMCHHQTTSCRSRRLLITPSTCLVMMMESSMSMEMSKLMQLMLTPLISLRTSSSPLMRPVTPWAAMTMSRMLPAMMLPGQRFCHLRFLTAKTSHRQTIFLQIQKASHHSKHMPRDDDGEQYEYGDVETHAIDADTSDFSPHQFIAPDEARDPMGSDDNEQDAASNDAARSKILSAEVFDSEDVPSPDNFLQISKKTKHMPHDDDGEQYEYGDVETHAIDAG